MTRHDRAAGLIKAFERTYPEAHCELDYSNPLELLIATILSAQCTDKRVNMVTPALFKRCRTARAYAEIDSTELELMIQSAGFFRAKAKSIKAACADLVAKHGGHVPRTMEALTSLRGVGRKTANVVLGNAFDINEGVVVDTHVQRLSHRLGLTRHTDPVKIEQDLMKLVPQPKWTIFSHWLIWHGRRRCTARAPDCPGCEVRELCPSAGKFTKAKAQAPGAPKKAAARALFVAAMVWTAVAQSAPVLHLAPALILAAIKVDPAQPAEKKQVRSDLRKLALAAEDMRRMQPSDLRAIKDWAEAEYDGELARISGLTHERIEACLVAAQASEDSSEKAEALMISRRFDESASLSRKAAAAKLAAIYSELTEYAPAERGYHARLVSVYEAGFHDFAKARALREAWLKGHPTDIWIKAELADSDLEEGRFRECVEHAREARKLLAKVTGTYAGDAARYRAALRMLELAALAVGTSDTAAPFLLDDLNTELAKLPADFQIRWDWRGTRYFIEHSDAAELAPHREWLLALIDAAAAPNRDAILEKLRALPQPPEKSPLRGRFKRLANC